MWFKKKDKKQAKKQELKQEQTSKTKKSVKTEQPKKVKEENKAEEKRSKGVRPSYRVIYDMSEKVWLIKKDGAKRVIRKVATKAEATKIAKELSENQNLNLTIHKKDGKFQKKS